MLAHMEHKPAVNVHIKKNKYHNHFLKISVLISKKTGIQWHFIIANKNNQLSVNHVKNVLSY